MLAIHRLFHTKQLRYITNSREDIVKESTKNIIKESTTKTLLQELQYQVTKLLKSTYTIAVSVQS